MFVSRNSKSEKKEQFCFLFWFSRQTIQEWTSFNIKKWTTCSKLTKTALNNTSLPTLLQAANNIEQYWYAWFRLNNVAQHRQQQRTTLSAKYCSALLPSTWNNLFIFLLCSISHIPYRTMHAEMRYNLTYADKKLSNSRNVPNKCLSQDNSSFLTSSLLSNTLKNLFMMSLVACSIKKFRFKKATKGRKRSCFFTPPCWQQVSSIEL